MQLTSVDQAGSIFMQDESTVWQIIGFRHEMSLPPICPQPRRVQGGIHLDRLQPTKCLPKRAVSCPPAPRARPVPRRQGHRLVQKKQLGPGSRRHHLALPTLPLQRTDDPGAALPAGRTEPPLVIMQDPAIAGENPSRGVGDNFAGRQYAVLQRHPLVPEFGKGCPPQILATRGLAKPHKCAIRPE